MTYSEKYSTYKWIKVKRHVDNPSLTPEERLRALEKHHLEETNFLIAEVRHLASLLDNALKLPHHPS